MVAVHVNSVLSGEKFTLKLGLKTTSTKLEIVFNMKSCNLYIFSTDLYYIFVFIFNIIHNQLFKAKRK